MKLDFLSQRFILIGVFTCLLLSACRSIDKLANETAPLPPATVATLAPTLIPTSAKATQYPTLDEILYDEDYLKDCKLKYPPVYDRQIGFMEIYPGASTVDDLVNRLGTSYKFTKVNEEKEYFYTNTDATSFYHFFTKTNIIESIVISSNSEAQTILEKYGCPDLINAEALTDDAFETSIEFNKTFFWYVQAGMWVRFESYPIHYSEIPSTIGFEIPNSLSPIIYFDEFSKPVSFSEAIINE
jgi:hypothetical protein